MLCIPYLVRTVVLCDIKKSGSMNCFRALPLASPVSDSVSMQRQRKLQNGCQAVGRHANNPVCGGHSARHLCSHW